MLFWDAVATAVGATSCLNIAYAMFMYHVSFTCEKEKLREGLVTGMEKCVSSVKSLRVCPRRKAK